jgi:hypothetical protein
VRAARVAELPGTIRQRRDVRVRVWFLLSCFVVTFALSTSALASRATTQPGTTLRVFVTLTDKGIHYTMFDEIETGGQVGLVPARGAGLRGEVAIFRVQNKGKKPHDFALLGKKTGRISPGRRGSFALVLLRRGSFPYQSTLDRGKPGFRGLFIVR